jgi:ABC-2 type transport system ATP-binding protein
VVLDDSQSEILNRFGRMKQLIVEFENEVEPVNLPAGRVVKEEDNKLFIEFDREQISAFDLILSLKEHRGIADISIKEENIETIVTHIYEKGAQ